ncbi:Hypothetical protein CINCED_3A006185 [Cinara cedri]|uniref:Uncharacterized protein n=1 Tax=Cinara cedri TaxID=506608 RepID=A0A5E4MVE7_9HEMI|nr:Hypothetical protein CINCED_3A006185 [Cinara cedri]
MSLLGHVDHPAFNIIKYKLRPVSVWSCDRGIQDVAAKEYRKRKFRESTRMKYFRETLKAMGTKSCREENRKRFEFRHEKPTNRNIKDRKKKARRRICQQVWSNQSL